MLGWNLVTLEASEPPELEKKFEEWQVGKNVKIEALQYGESACEAQVRVVAETRKTQLVRHCTLLVFFSFVTT